MSERRDPEKTASALLALQLSAMLMPMASRGISAAPGTGQAAPSSVMQVGRYPRI